MHPSLTFQFDRAIREYAQWKAVATKERSPAPSWWWSAALAQRDDPRPLPSHDLGAMIPEKSYGELARRMLAEIGAQSEKPWPDEFPTRYRPKGLDEAASSAEPAAQAASVAATPL